MDKHKEQALACHKKGYNCAQAVACAFAEELGRDEKEVTVLAESLGALFERFTRIVCSEDFYIGDYDGKDVILLGTDDVDEGSYLTDYLKSENSVK